MARYSDDMPKWFIDAKELWKMLIQQREKNKELSCSFTVNAGINQAVGLMNSLPAADVVEVVRCKDCKHYMTIHCTCDGCCIADDWYCADGERK